MKNEQTDVCLRPMDPLRYKSIGHDEHQAILISSNRLRVWEVNGAEENESPDTNSTLRGVE
jgi:hypothetical protein